MSRPWKHPNSGVYWFRRGVPQRLRRLVGKREEKISLRTKDPSEAKSRHAKIAAEVEARWSNLELPPQTLSEKEAHSLVGHMHQNYLDKCGDNPSLGFWSTELGPMLWQNPDPTVCEIGSPDWDALNLRIGRKTEAENWCLMQADYELNARGLVVDELGRKRLARAIGAAMQSAAQKLKGITEGQYGDGLRVAPDAASIFSTYSSAQTKDVGFDELFSGWRREKRPGEKTSYSWERVFKQLGEFVGHRDANRLVAEDIVRWKNALIETGMKGKTIRDSKIAPVRAILQWGVDNRHLKVNVAERITVNIKGKISEKIRGYSDEEAALVLSASLCEKDALRRWAPWLCAYSGARISEVCQLRAEDVQERDGVWHMHFAAEAGSLKNINSERAVPIHQALIDGGFLKFVHKAKGGPLFSDVKPDRFGSRGGNGTKVLSRWIRTLGITDIRISPSHSWRHRFKTLGRRYGLASDIVDSMTGHGKKTVADNYGEFETSALQRELAKIPTIPVNGSLDARPKLPSETSASK